MYIRQALVDKYWTRELEGKLCATAPLTRPSRPQGRRRCSHWLARCSNLHALTLCDGQMWRNRYGAYTLRRFTVPHKPLVTTIRGSSETARVMNASQGIVRLSIN